MKQEAQLIAVTTPTLPIRLIQALLLTAIGFMVAQLLSYDYRKSLPESRIDVNKVYFNRGDSVVPPEEHEFGDLLELPYNCLLYTSPSPRDATLSRMPSSA